MNICLIMDNPETPRHPVIGVALHKLGSGSLEKDSPV